MRNQKQYVIALRVATFAVVAFLWYLSIIWSADGFSINDPDLVWVGIGLALSVTVAQLVFNRGSANPTIFLVGLAAYLYGFATNFIGISAVIGLDFTTISFTENPFGFVVSGLGVFALSLIVEAAPESFLLWALYPEEQSPGDFLSTLFGGMNLPQRRSKGRVPMHRQNQNVPKQSRSQNAQRSVPQTFPVRSEQSLGTPNVQAEVDAFVQQYKAKNKGKSPSYRIIVQNTSLTSTSQVSQYIKR